MSCNYCNADICVKTVQYTMPLLTPMTREQEIRQQLTNLTGEFYIPIEARYCPMCGEKLSKNKAVK